LRVFEIGNGEVEFEGATGIDGIEFDKNDVDEDDIDDDVVDDEVVDDEVMDDEIILGNGAATSEVEVEEGPGR